MNIKRLRTLVSILKMHSKGTFKNRLRFNMDLWHCETAACAGGLACLYKPFNKEGLELAVDGTVPRFKNLEGLTAIQEFFDMPLRFAEYIFSAQSYGVWPTEEDVIDHIEKVMKWKKNSC